MYSLFMFVLFIVGLVQAKDLFVVASGLFALASAIETFSYKYFRNKDKQD